MYLETVVPYMIMAKKLILVYLYKSLRTNFIEANIEEYIDLRN